MFFLLKAHPYDTDVAFAIDEEPERIERYLRQQLRVAPSLLQSIKDADGRKGGTWQGNTIQFDNGAILVRIKGKVTNPRSMALVAHETLHATAFILRRAGIPFTEETEEAYAYLQQSLTHGAFQRIGKEWWV